MDPVARILDIKKPIRKTIIRGLGRGELAEDISHDIEVTYNIDTWDARNMVDFMKRRHNI